MMMRKRFIPIIMALLIAFAMVPINMGIVYAADQNTPPTPLTSEITVKAYTDRISVVVNSDRYADGILFFPIALRQKETPEKLGSDTYVLDLQDNGVGHTYFFDELTPGTQYYVYVAAFDWQPGYDGYLRFSDWSEPVAVKTLAVKRANPLKIKAKTATVKYSKVKKSTQKLAITKVISFTNKGQGTKTYKKLSGNKKITINKTTGKVTVKKGLKKGKYKVKIKVTAAGNSNYKAGSKTVTSTIRVK
jgi:hypothetical protein